MNRYLAADDFDAAPIAYDARIAYGDRPQQHADLRLPEPDGPHPVAIVIHGGCWEALHTHRDLEPLAEALAAAGWATWNLEHRSLIHEGGGWPGTFLDIAAGTDRLREVAKRHPLDLGRVVAIGHSSGGHLALWLAARPRIAPGSRLHTADPLRIAGAIGLGAIAGLRSFHRLEGRACEDAAVRLIGGAPEEVPDRYAQADPEALLPLGVPQLLLHGADDRHVPVSHARDYSERARARGDDVRLVVIPEAAHFEPIAPGSKAWPRIRTPLADFLDGLGPRMSGPGAQAG